jgi:hypothetical protein
MSVALRRFATALLTLAFVAGGGGLADLDALLYHGGSTAPEQPHYDQLGGCGAHAEHCVLAVTGSLRQLAGGVGPVARISRALERPLPPAPTPTPRQHDRSNLQPTRAPPAS